MQNKQYQAEWYKQHQEEQRRKHREYYEANKAKIKRKQRAYRERNKAKCVKQSRDYYHEHKNQINERLKSNRLETKTLVSAILLHYGCQNPECGWKKEWKPSHLDFHHFDPTQKEAAVSKLLTFQRSKIANEINKCVVLCRCCHAEHHIEPIQLNDTMLCKVTSELDVIS